MQRLDAYGLLIVYGEGYKAPLADAMIKALLKDGVEDVMGLKGGFEGWEDAGLPVAKGDDAGRRPGATAGDRWQRQPVEDE
jgi:3-mercaptopyruvate sulfurtransferase SseA